MSIFKKIFATFFVCSLFLLGTSSLFLYQTTETSIENEIYEHFRSIASLQSNRIDAIFKKNAERMKLVTSRTQLRISLRSFLSTKDPRQLERIHRILDDALSSIDSFSKISILSTHGELVFSTDGALRTVPGYYPSAFLEKISSASPETLVLNADGQLLLLLGGPLILDESVIGVLIIESQPVDLISSVSNFDGLKETGEILLVRKLADGERQFLLPSRFDPQAALKRVVPAFQEESGGRTGFDSSKLHLSRDYRGREVLGLHKNTSIPGWEVVVKIDREEAFSELREIRSALWRISSGFILLIFVISLVLARYLTRPLASLTTLTSKISDGYYHLRADESSRDELGTLGKSFNLMADKLLSKQAELQDKVRQLEKEVSERIKAEQEVETLKGILPLCSICKKIRDENNVWHNVDIYIDQHSQADISHSLCPTCMQERYPDTYRKIMEKKHKPS